MPLTSSSMLRTIASKAVAAVPHDSTDQASGPSTQGLFIVATGNVSCVVGGVTVTLTAVPAFTKLPFAATRVNSTGTTATVLFLY